MHLTIQPGLLFSENAVRAMRLAGLTDDDVAADLAAIESGSVTPAEFIAQTSSWFRGVRAYVRSLCVVAGVSLTSGL